MEYENIHRLYRNFDITGCADKEDEAVRVIGLALAALSHRERRRVLAYWQDRADEDTMEGK